MKKIFASSLDAWVRTTLHSNNESNLVLTLEINKNYFQDWISNEEIKNYIDERNGLVSSWN